MSTDDPAPDGVAVNIGSETPSRNGSSEIVLEDNIAAETPSPEIQQTRVDHEETTVTIGTWFQLISKSFPGGLMNRASGLALVIGLAVVAAYTTAGVCQLGEVNGYVTAGVGLASFVGVIILGLVWITHGSPD